MKNIIKGELFKMNKKFVSILLAGLMLTTPISVFANTQTAISSVEVTDVEAIDLGQVYDEVLGEYLTLKLYEVSETSYRAQSIDSNNNVIYDYTYNSIDDTLTCNITGDVQVLELETTSDVAAFAYNEDFKPYWQYISVSHKVITAGVTLSAAAIATKIAPAIASVLGVKVAVVTNFAKTFALFAANDIYNAISSGDWGKRAYFDIYWGSATLTKYWDEGYYYVYVPNITEIIYSGSR